MFDIFQKYLQSISKKFSYEETTEIGYRTDFEDLLKEIFKSINVNRIDHDAKSDQGNKPDFVVRKNDIPILYIEAKNIGISLDKIEESDQMSRYFGYANLVLTDYVEFRFYRNGIRYEEPIKIAEIDKHFRILTPIENNYEHLVTTLLEFTESYKEPIRSGKHLAKIMGGKAQRIRDIVCSLYGENSLKDKDLSELYEAIKTMLVHDLTIKTFADMYAQTMVYGLFVARYYDNTLDDFTRQKARELIPNSNQFLKRFFDHIVGIDFKNNLKFVVDELCEVYSHADIGKLMGDYFKTSRGSSENYDPVIHFYEDFLKEYDPILRKKMGAFYTPQPVVDFIVKSVDSILKKEFGLINGIADTSKLSDSKHKVQILDPATGTGTFISTIIREIYIHFRLHGQEGRWPAYVHNDLLPRIHGFELMMAPYTIAHLRLGIAFKKTGFWDFHRRLGIYLTNSLENSDANQLSIAFGLAESIAEESKQASVIKNDTPIMVVVGNPPYSGVSSNETKFANSLVERYKVEPGGKQKLQERKHWLNDDYVKFFALAESMIEKNNNGIVAMITNNGYLDNPTFRGMRWHIAKTFDKIYVLDLHGNSKKKEKAPDGGIDENVFNIMQGVGIILAIKTGKKESNQLGNVYHADLYGTQKYKFGELTKLLPQWQQIALDPKMLYFVPKNAQGKDEYEKGVKLDELFIENVTGIVTARDKVVLDINKENLIKRIQHFADPQYPDEEIRTWLFPNKKADKYKPGDSRGWKLSDARQKVFKQDIENNIRQIEYRPFDKRFIYYTPEMVDWGRFNFMENYLENSNIGLMICRQQKILGFNHILVHKGIVESSYVSNRTSEIGYTFPLYIYHKNGEKIANFNIESIKEFTKNITQNYQPEDILDYIYAVLHSPSYRKKYKEFLKIDFPRVPYPKDTESFKKLVEMGRELRELHLMESPLLNDFITTYPIGGSNIVEKVTYIDNKVFINKDQYFGNISQPVWDFYIGGYQPAQKWLKDRKGRTLDDDDLEHYQKIIVALNKTIKIMGKINEINFY